MIQRRRTLAVAVLLGTALVVGVAAHNTFQASAAALVPFKAEVSEQFTAHPCGPYARCIYATGTGQATHLGDISEVALVEVDTNPADLHNGCQPESRTTTLTAANGDQITMTANGYTACNGANTATDSYVVTGGTGRFAGATGSGTDSNTHTFTGPGVGVATVTYSGTLSSVGSLT
jgi:hypothetical protein